MLLGTRCPMRGAYSLKTPEVYFRVRNDERSKLPENT
jgi:hypothetical protein